MKRDNEKNERVSEYKKVSIKRNRVRINGKRERKKAIKKENEKKKKGSNENKKSGQRR